MGVQYCGNCGADARAYESCLLLLKKMREAGSQQRFERVISYAGQVHGFEPAGPSGRRFIAEVAELRDTAEKNIKRRDQLKEQIPIEIRAENFERAEMFIKQYRELAEDKRVFEGEAQQLPDLMLRRDLQRARRAMKNHEWDSAARICDELVRAGASEHSEVQNLGRAIRHHALFALMRTGALIVFGLILAYLLSLPVAAKVYKGNFGAVTKLFYRPALWMYERSVVGVPMQRYAKLWLRDTELADRFRASLLEEEDELDDQAVKPDELAQKKQAEYARLLTEIEADQATFIQAWPVEYTRELDVLMERRRTAGDFEGWAVVQTERKRFDDTRQINEQSNEEPSELSVLKGKYRQMLADQKLLRSRKLVTLCKRYVNDLTDMQKAYMLEGKMDLATAVNAEIRHVRGTPAQIEAEEILASSATAGLVESESPTQMLLPGTVENRVQEVAKMRGVFESELAAVERVASQKGVAWPEKYLLGLTDLMDKFQRAGDYGGWESVRDETGRFEADRAILQRNIVAQPAELATLQKTFYLLREENRRSRAESVINATEKHVKKLQELQKKLTVEGQMDTAASVNAEIKRVRSRVDFIDAQNEISPQGPPLPPTMQQVIAPATVGATRP
jgi:hypothetical protein